MRKMAASLIHLFLLPLFLISSSFTARVAATGAANEFINEVCAKTLYNDTCIKSLSSVPQSANTNIEGLARISLDLASQSGSETANYISRLLEKTGKPGFQQCLNDCSENYMDAVEQLNDSLAAFDTRNYPDVNTWVTAAMSDAESCEDGCRGQGRRASTLIQKNAYFNKLCSNTLAITNLLQN